MPFIKDNQNIKIESLFYFIKGCSRYPKCHALSGEIVKIAENRISNLDDRVYREKLHARLSRIYLPINYEEAKILFKIEENSFFAVGSDDVEYVSLIVKLASKSKNIQIDPKLAYKLAKFCEVNGSTGKKWDWVETTYALTEISGANLLAQIARWHDRDVANFGLTLPVTISTLLRNKIIEPTIAISLLKLLDARYIPNIHWENIISSTSNSKKQNEILLDILAQLEKKVPIEIADGYKPKILEKFKSIPLRTEELKIAINNLENKYELSQIPSNTHIYTFTKSESKNETTQFHDEQKNKDYQEILDDAQNTVNPLDAESFESFLVKIQTIQNWESLNKEIFGPIRAKVDQKNQKKFMEIIVGTEKLSLDEKLNLLDETRKGWINDSPTKLQYMSELKTTIISEHAFELLTSGIDLSYYINWMSDILGTEVLSLILELLKSTTVNRIKIPSSTWLVIALIFV